MIDTNNEIENMKIQKKNINNDPLIIVNDNETIGWEEFFDKNKEQKL